jgi:hypothetical protein
LAFFVSATTAAIVILVFDFYCMHDGFMVNPKIQSIGSKETLLSALELAFVDSELFDEALRSSL